MKLIKLSKIAMAVAAMTTAPAAFALTPAQIDSSTVRLWLSGASAPTASLYKGALTLCQGMSYKDATGVTHINPGTRDAHLYLESASAGKLPGGAGDRMAYTCTVQTDDTRAGSLEGQKMVVFHTVEGGSFNYVTPHITIAGEVNPNLPGNLKRTSNIEGLAAGGQCAAGAGAAEVVNVDISGILNPVGVYRGCATTTQTFTAGQALRAAVTDAPDRPEGGLSDTEYVINKLNLDITTDLGAIGSEVPTYIGQVFGVATSYPLYYQLQQNDIAAGKIAATCDDAPFTAASPNLTAACQPVLAAAKYTAFANVDNVGPLLDGSLLGAPAGTKVNLARRAITSGTQSASNLRFLNKPCAIGAAQGALNPSRAIHSTAKVVITESSSTGGVKTVLTTATNAGELGMGIVSMENVSSGTGTDGKWAFVKLDGISSNADSKQRATAIDGTYGFWYEIVGFTASTAFVEGQDLVNAVVTSLSNPGITDLTGLFITKDAGVSGSNVSSFARAGNSCQPAF